ncbi:MAG: M3 family metallopeptidase [Muribaculaceae bacterium]|nr:M3 family metallopeptidase [Muribaculaceae bacterium]
MKKLVLIAIAVMCSCMTLQAAKKPTVNSSNPFMAQYTTKYAIPPFNLIKMEHYMPALKAGIEQQNKEIDAIVNNNEAPTFENTVLALDNSGEILNKVALVLYALNESDATPEMQAVAKEFLPALTAQNDEVYMNDRLFARIKAVHDGAKGLSTAQTRLIDKYYKKMVRNGALLNAEQKAELKELNRQLSELQLSFQNNLMTEIASNIVWVDDAKRLSGLSQACIDGAAKLAADKGQPGKWAFTATASTRLDVLGGAHDRDLRRDMYETYINTASRGNEFDNTTNINKIIKLRMRKANLLGFETYGDYAVDNVMAKKVDAAESLLMQIFTPAIAKVKEEVADMQAYVNNHGGNFKIAPYDYYYYAAKVKEQKYNFNEDELRPYFELNNVVKNGIFYVANKLWGITFTEIKDAPKYHPEVIVYDVKDADGKHLAVFMTDYFPRPTKAPGAWMSDFAFEYNYNGKMERPIVYNVASFAPPTKELPSLLNIDQVETLFHEFGHAIHSMLTIAPFRGGSGTNVDRDFVELPSQLNEHWAWLPEVLKNYAVHYKTGEVIPQQLVDKMLESNKFNMGFNTTELVGAALLDIEWHKLNWCGDIDVKAFERSVKRRINMPEEVEFRYRTPYFKHIFGDDMYSCGYYTYLWAQVLEADAWERFKVEGPLNTKVAADYRKFILETGDSEDAMTLYKKFRGAEPTPDALLRNRGFK